jgi:hypothetical protein
MCFPYSTLRGHESNRWHQPSTGADQVVAAFRNGKKPHRNNVPVHARRSIGDQQIIFLERGYSFMRTNMYFISYTISSDEPIPCCFPLTF